MPKYSKRELYIKFMRRLHVCRLGQRLMRKHRGMVDAMEDMIDLRVFAKLVTTTSRRYLFRKEYRKRALDVFSLDLPEESETTGVEDSRKHLGPDEFLKKYRMYPDEFKSLLALLEDHPVFSGGSRGPKQCPKEQLMLLLHFLGQPGCSARTNRSSHFIGYGTHYNFLERAVEAVCSLREQVVFWPDHEERKAISTRMASEYGFPNCVGMGDGTLFPLAFAPSSEDASDYSGRKYGYSITCFIINDDKRRIRSYLAGWPGSVHDNRVFGKMKVNTSSEDHFSGTQYILSDSALENCSYVVAAFKKPPLRPMPPNNERFNTKLARARIISEHVIGLLKGRFPWLRSIRNLVTDDKESMMRILKLIDCCVILHNLMVPDEAPEEIEWYFDDGYTSDVDDESRAPRFDEELYRTIPKGSAKDERRRRLQTWMEYTEYCPIN